MTATMNISATSHTPKVMLDKKNLIFEIEGESRPENVYDFYCPIITKLKNELESISRDLKQAGHSKTSFKADFKLSYFNSSSAKFISDILSLLKS